MQMKLNLECGTSVRSLASASDNLTRTLELSHMCSTICTASIFQFLKFLKQIRPIGQVESIVGRVPQHL